jgi:hypothetical protein
MSMCCLHTSHSRKRPVSIVSSGHGRSTVEKYQTSGEFAFALELPAVSKRSLAREATTKGLANGV